MEKTIWFKAKRYGWGWYPSTFQGFLVVILYVILSVESAVLIGKYVADEKTAVTIFVPLMIFYTIILILISYITGEKPGWHWGKK